MPQEAKNRSVNQLHKKHLTFVSVVCSLACLLEVNVKVADTLQVGGG
jgi:hypothetical protein